MRNLMLVFFILGWSMMTVAAQDGALDVTSTAEYDIGLQCPVAQALAPDGAALWVLMKGCFRSGYSLIAFDIADGTALDIGDDFADELASIGDGYVDRWTNPLVFIGESVLSLHYIASETYEPRSLLLSLDGAASEPLMSDAALAELLFSFSDYPESAVYNHDHTQAALVTTDALIVVDLAAGEAIFSLSLEPDSYNAFPSFSVDGQILYVGQFDNIDDVENYDSTLTSYSLPDGALLNSYAVPSAFVWVSPDGKYAVGEVGSSDSTQSELLVVDLRTGGLSEAFSLYEDPRPLLNCVNDGRDMSDVDFTVSGTLSLGGLTWLPDSSGFVITRSYNGESSGGGSPCAFNYSRLNRLEVNSGAGG